MLLSRANHRRAAWVALFALWLQLALSFGHRHAEDFAGLGASSAAFAGQAQVDDGAPPGSPGNPNPDGLGHEACAICAAISLADCLILPDLAPAAAPAPVGRESLRIPDALVLVDTSYRLFQTRAPPVI